MAKIVENKGTQVLVKLSSGDAGKLAAQTGQYKWTKWLGVLFVIGFAITLVLLWKDILEVPIGSTWPNVFGFVMIGVGLALWLYKPSQIRANNEEGVWMERTEYDQLERDGKILTKFRNWV